MRQNDQPARDHRYLTVAQVDKLMTVGTDNHPYEKLL